MLKIQHYKFCEQSGETDTINLLKNIDDYLLLSNQEILNMLEMQHNFYILIENLLKLMNYLHINQYWTVTANVCTSKINIQFINKTKKFIQHILIKSLLNKEYFHIIFMFHQHAPFNYNIETIYKLLISSILAMPPTVSGINIQQTLSMYLTNAAIHNNAYAIKILINEYHVSPTIVWRQLFTTYKNISLTNMPIMYITDSELTAKIKKFFTVSCKEQEQIFMMMLHKIDFNDKYLYDGQIQEIFRCAVKNNFLQAISYLLAQQDFCRHFDFAHEMFIANNREENNLIEKLQADKFILIQNNQQLTVQCYTLQQKYNQLLLEHNRVVQKNILLNLQLNSLSYYNYSAMSTEINVSKTSTLQRRHSCYL